MKRRSQFSLQSLMLWLVLTGLALGWWGDNRRYASRAAELENQVLELTIALQETERGLERYGVDFYFPRQNPNRSRALRRDESAAQEIRY